MNEDRAICQKNPTPRPIAIGSRSGETCDLLHSFHGVLMKITPLLCLALIMQPLLAGGFAEEARNKKRQLYGFETQSEIKELLGSAENVELSQAQDYGVTEGLECLRIAIPKGEKTGSFVLGKNKLTKWHEYDYLAIDLYTEDESSYVIAVELSDPMSVDGTTRWTFERITTHPGPQTLLYPITRVARYARSWTDWEDLTPDDKMQMDKLTKVRIFIKSKDDRDAVFWIDQIRLLQEDAAKPKMVLNLPPQAIAFKFGTTESKVDGFKPVPPTKALKKSADFGFISESPLQKGGEHWPEPLSGTFVFSPSRTKFRFEANVPNGRYEAIVCAGKIISKDYADQHFYLRLNDRVLEDNRPSHEEYFGKNYLFRFLQTPYSEKPHSSWDHYISRMYPLNTTHIDVRDGKIALEAANHFLSALILVPSSSRKDSSSFVQHIQEQRRDTFEKGFYVPPRKKVPKAGKNSFIVFAPKSTNVLPDTVPDSEERSRQGLEIAAARDQSVSTQLAVLPLKDLGNCTLKLSDLRGKLGHFSEKNIRGHHQKYRWDGRSVSEMVLYPSLNLNMESHVTQSYWLRFHVPENAVPGIYKGSFTFKTEHADSVKIPIRLEIYPFKLEATIPAAFGMYYQYWNQFPENRKRQLIKDQFQFMRDLGMTTVSAGTQKVLGIEGDHVTMQFDPLLYEIAREVGMGQHPEQTIMATSLNIGRVIGRKLLGKDEQRVDQKPGIELQQPHFKELYLDAMKQYRDFIKSTNLPVAMEITDEPREIPNPWNRTLADTVAYADLLHKIKGLRTFVTPLGDTNDWMEETPVRDYTVLIDHADIISVHAWKHSGKFLRETAKRGKTLWLFNNGMERMSWGFYMWRAGAKGRWEWHFCFPNDKAMGGYLGREWYNPFTDTRAYAPMAPYTEYPGGFLYQSQFLTASEGITDYAYVYTLQKAIERSRKNKLNLKTIQKAEFFLQELQKSIPLISEHWGMGGKKGLGLEESTRIQPEKWRQKIAEFLKILIVEDPHH